jgi:hypothetical protein
MNKEIEEYNELVDEWNRRFSHLCEGIKLESEPESNISGRLKQHLQSGSMSPTNRVKITRDVVGDFATINLTDENNGSKLTKGELAHLIVRKSNKILKGRTII